MKVSAKVFMTIIILLSFSCKKDKLVSTTFTGKVMTNGSQDKIKMSSELPQPIIYLYQDISTGTITGGDSHKEVASVEIDKNGNFHLTIDLYEDQTYFYGISGLDTTYYTNDTQNSSYTFYLNFGTNSIIPGIVNNINIYKSTNGWVIPRFINTNNNPNNQDKFQYFRGIGGGGGQSPNNPIFTGQTDTTMNWIHKTWSGKQTFGRSGISNSHYVEAKLTRNGIQIDTIIPYFVPPFDTSIVEIRY